MSYMIKGIGHSTLRATVQMSHIHDEEKKRHTLFFLYSVDVLLLCVFHFFSTFNDQVVFQVVCYQCQTLNNYY